jgi:hypothetical protein
MRVIVFVAVLFAFTFAAQRLDTLRIIKADTNITYDTTLVIKSFKDTVILVQTDTISKGVKKVIPVKKEEVKVILIKKEEVKVVPVKKEEVKIIVPAK